MRTIVIILLAYLSLGVIELALVTLMAWRARRTPDIEECFEDDGANPNGDEAANVVYISAWTPLDDRSYTA